MAFKSLYGQAYHSLKQPKVSKSSRSATGLRWLRVLLILALLLGGGAAPARAAAGIQVTSSTAEVDYPEQVTFRVSAESTDSIAAVTLIYGKATDACPVDEHREPISIHPGTSVSGEWSWPFWESGSMPPGAVVWWRWEIRDIGGNTLLTDPQTIVVEDTNYQWKTLSRGSLRLYWAEGSDDFGVRLLDIAAGSLEKIETKTGLVPAGEIELRIYPSIDAMQDALLYITDWAAGVAFPEYNVTMIGIGPDELMWAREVIPHELAHLVTGMRVANCAGNDLPHWYDEGLSEYAVGFLPQDELDEVLAALEQDRLGDLADLTEHFPFDSAEADLAYKQSRVMVSYLIDLYGLESLNTLLDGVQGGLPGEAALRKAYGLDSDGVDKTWRADQGYGEAPVLDYFTPTPTSTRTPRPTRTPKVSVTPTPPPTITPTSTATAAAAAATAVAAAAATATPPPTNRLLNGSFNIVLWVLLGGALMLILAVGLTLLIVSRMKKR